MMNHAAASSRVGFSLKDGPLNFREMNLAVFERRQTPHVLFQPRLEPWYAWHRDRQRLPAACAGMSMTELFDDLGISMRYVHYYTDMPSPVHDSFDPTVRIETHMDGPQEVTVMRTPHGDLVRRRQRNEDGVWHTVRYPVASADDLRALLWAVQRREYVFDFDAFKRGAAFVAERGWPQFWVTKSPYQILATHWMTLEDFIYALMDAPALVEQVMAAMDRSYDRQFEQIIEHRDKVRIVNFGENLHAHLLGPENFERYLLPWYQKRAGQIEAAGIFTHVHIDGAVTGLLPYLKDLPFSGVEALTPQPQGDVTLEQIAEHMGDKVLLDGIPAILFLDSYPRERLMACVERLVELFGRRLILGVSDEVPEGGGEEALERVRMVSDWCRAHKVG